MFGRKHTCARSDAGRKIAFAAIFYWTLYLNQIEARKQLSNDNTATEARRSPLYESRNVNGFQIVSDAIPADQYIRLQHPEDRSFVTQSPSRRPKLYVLKKNPRTDVRNGQYYSAAVIQATAQPVRHSPSRGFRAQPSPTPEVLYYATPSSTPLEEYQSTIPEARKYAFAYAVRPKDGYTTVADDFSLSHKESRDGKVTMGEYKVLLPDGRLQVVRYTADGKSGFKADVTYEAEGHEHSHEQIKPVSKPSSEIRKQYVAPPLSSGATPFRTNPIFVGKPLRSQPSISPSLYYQSGSDDYHQLDHHHIRPSPSSLNPVSPTPQIFYKVSPSPQSVKKQNPTAGYIAAFKRAVGSTPSSYYKSQTPTPRSIYDKINNQNSHYAPVSRGQRAGPANAYLAGPIYKEVSPSALPTYQDDSHSAHLHYEHHVNPAARHQNGLLQSNQFSSASVAHSPPENYQQAYASLLFTHAHPSAVPERPRRHRILKQVAYSPEVVNTI